MEQRKPDTQAHILATGRRLTAVSGYAGVGLNELLKEAGVPKGSFYHYFPSKEAYGIALLKEFANDYHGKLNKTLNHPGKDSRSRLIAYFTQWRKQQSSDVPEERCLVVKLSAEVADLSPEMSRVLEQSVQSIINHLASTLRDGVVDGSIGAHANSKELAATIYYLWLGASLVAGLSGSKAALTSALRATRDLIPAT
ncbi:TetR/AcrR family transcriptional regulator [Granulosicoccus sp. 3-233]|uniref:TetR/AcrR family transcriptional regulator n=1 Tax=Granulosicoccus sp. 3-233 TaxID=3417969 RepID=UPI003D35461C